MPTVHLIPIQDPLARSLSEGSTSVEVAPGVRVDAQADQVHEVVRRTLTLSPAPRPWIGYLAVDANASAIVGTCAFKAAPSPDGSVEIAYYTFPEMENRGYATEMARRLLDIAWGQPGIARVIAHTLPEPSASTRILEKLGFRNEGEVMDPEDGRIWSWSIPRPRIDAPLQTIGLP